MNFNLKDIRDNISKLAVKTLMVLIATIFIMLSLGMLYVLIVWCASILIGTFMMTLTIFVFLLLFILLWNEVEL